MNRLSIIGLFCEDIREEVGDQFTLIGLMSDNVNVAPLKVEEKNKGGSFSEINRTLSKVCVFVRANFDPSDPIKDIKLNLVLPDGQVLELGGATPDTIEKSKSEAIEKGNPLAGVIIRAVVHGIRLTDGGMMRLEGVIGSETLLLAFMNFAHQPATSSRAH